MINKFNTFDQIKNATENGGTVYWCSDAYEVRKSSNGRWLIICTWNGHATGLEGSAAKPEKFYSRSAD